MVIFMISGSWDIIGIIVRIGLRIIVGTVIIGIGFFSSIFIFWWFYPLWWFENFFLFTFLVLIIFISQFIMFPAAKKANVAVDFPTTFFSWHTLLTTLNAFFSSTRKTNWSTIQ